MSAGGWGSPARRPYRWKKVYGGMPPSEAEKLVHLDAAFDGASAKTAAEELATVACQSSQPMVPSG
jgi:hypothetical protein